MTERRVYTGEPNKDASPYTLKQMGLGGRLDECCRPLSHPLYEIICQEIEDRRYMGELRPPSETHETVVKRFRAIELSFFGDWEWIDTGKKVKDLFRNASA